MYKKISSLISTIFQHPFNKKKPVFAFYRLLKWQIQKLIYDEKPIIQKYWGSTKVISWKRSFQSMWLNYNYYMDWKEFHLLARYIKPGNILFDVGSNIGIYTLWMSYVSKGKATIYAFEPHPVTFSRLNQQVAINNLTNIKVNNIALADCIGDIPFTNSKDDRNHILLDIGHESTINVNTTTLDAFCEKNNISQIDFLKIDVEGAELLVFKGAQKLLKEHRIKLIQFELDYDAENFLFKTNVNQLLKEFGYIICDYNIEKNLFFEINVSLNKQQNIFALYDKQYIETILTNEDIINL